MYNGVMTLTETPVWRPELHVVADAPAQVWFIYARQSADHADGIDRQVEYCTQEIQRMGGIVGGIYADNEETADTKKRRYARPDYRRLMRDVASGSVRAFVAQDQDRLLRDIREGEDLIDLVEGTGIRIRTLRGGEPDLRTADGRMQVRMKAVIARQELEKKSERQRDGARRDADKGRFYAPRRAFGYDHDGSPIPAEADVVRDAYDRALRREPLRVIARAMNEAGLPTARGNQWGPTGVRAMLLNPRYIGWRVYRPGQDDEIRRRGDWEPIIGEDDWERVKALLTDPARKTNGDHPGGTARKWLGSGLYQCECGQRVKIAARGRGSENRAYNCPEWHVSRAASKVDFIVLTAVEGRLARGDAAELLAGGSPEMAEARLEAKRLEAELKKRRQWLDDGKIEPDDFLPMKRRIESELTVIRRKITAAARASVLAQIGSSDDPVGEFRRADLAVRREVIDALMEVVLHPSPRRYKGSGNVGRFDEDTVELRWRPTH